MSILSVDLASNRYRDIGVAILEFRDRSVLIEFVEASAYGLKGRPCVEDATSWLTDLASAHEADVIFIDGPQGWKDPANGLEHARRCERELATPGKTGLPGCVKPGSWTRMARFSIELFDALGAHGFSRVKSSDDLVSGRKLAIESFPTSAWRTLGLKTAAGQVLYISRSTDHLDNNASRVGPMYVDAITHSRRTSSFACWSGWFVSTRTSWISI